QRRRVTRGSLDENVGRLAFDQSARLPRQPGLLEELVELLLPLRSERLLRLEQRTCPFRDERPERRHAVHDLERSARQIPKTLCEVEYLAVEVRRLVVAAHGIDGRDDGGIGPYRAIPRDEHRRRRNGDETPLVVRKTARIV